jgi:hypothetical protein
MHYETNQHYHRRRAEQEFKLGWQARHPKVQSAHFKLFDLHVRCFLQADDTGEFEAAASAIRPQPRCDRFNGSVKRGQPA